MTIPEISPLFIISMCGLSTVCIGFFGVIAFVVLRYTSGELFEAFGIFDRGSGKEKEPSTARPPVTANRDLRAKAQQLDFEIPSTNQAGKFQAQSGSIPSPSSNTNPPSHYGENPNLRPNRQSRLNENTRDMNLQPPGNLSDNPNSLQAPPPPNFNPNSTYLPDERSNIGGRVGRHNTGRGQTGQRLDADTSGGISGTGRNISRNRDQDRRSDRNASRDDERFGGMYDIDGDGDVDM